MDSEQLFDIVLCPTGDAGSGFRVKNMPGGELQRRHIVDRASSLRSSLHVQADLVDVVHGTMESGGPPATLLIVDLRFQSPGRDRRFRKASVELRFADEQERSICDPEVLEIAPYDHFTLNQTGLSEESKLGAHVSIRAGAMGASVGAGGYWEQSTKAKRLDAATVMGSIIYQGRCWGPKNVARFALHENASQKDGIVSKLRIAILLRRHPGNDRFLAFVEIEAEVDARYALGNTIAMMAGRLSKDDPVVFDPQRCEPTRSDIDRENLGGCDIASFIGIAPLKTMSMPQKC
jgi:hypothetical protein